MKNVLSLLKPDEIKKVKFKKVGKNEILFHEDDFCEQIAIVVTGEIIIFSVSIKGNDLVYNVLKSGEIFGNNLVFSSKPYFRGNVLAREDSEVALIKKDVLLSLLSNNEQFLKEYLSIQSNFGLEVNLKLKMLSLSDAEERFMYYLKIRGNEIKFKNVTALSKEIFLSRETLSRLISKLIKKHVILRKDNYIKVLWLI